MLDRCAFSISKAMLLFVITLSRCLKKIVSNSLLKSSVIDGSGLIVVRTCGRYIFGIVLWVIIFLCYSIVCSIFVASER